MSSSRDLSDYEIQYKQLPFENIQLRYRRERVICEVQKHSPRSLLEVGCGEMPLFTDLPNSIDCTVIEPIAAFAENAVTSATGRQNVDVVRGMVEDFSPGDSRFDMVVLSCVLHETGDPKGMLAAVRRLCHPGSIVHVNVPNAFSVHRMLAAAMGLIPEIRTPSDTQSRMQQRAFTYDLTTLEHEINEAGFSMLESGGIFVKPFTHAQMQHLVDSGFMTDLMLEGLSKLEAWMPGMGSEIWMNAKVAE